MCAWSFSMSRAAWWRHCSSSRCSASTSRASTWLSCLSAAMSCLSAFDSRLFSSASRAKAVLSCFSMALSRCSCWMSRSALRSASSASPRRVCSSRTVSVSSRTSRCSASISASARRAASSSSTRRVCSLLSDSRTSRMVRSIVITSVRRTSISSEISESCRRSFMTSWLRECAASSASFRRTVSLLVVSICCDSSRCSDSTSLSNAAASRLRASALAAYSCASRLFCSASSWKRLAASSASCRRARSCCNSRSSLDISILYCSQSFCTALRFSSPRRTASTASRRRSCSRRSASECSCASRWACWSWLLRVAQSWRRSWSSRCMAAITSSASARFWRSSSAVRL
mmetsp:Transcript_25455/g.58691  ORF Transcript_25455/g.58691 Transcript_25455/m.58691 type:complete len:345 (+) Transcript_25455:828-1862(+)